jgi:centrin-3
MRAAELWSAFNKYDKNRSGKLDHKELRSALKTVGLQMDSKQSQALLDKYDRDGSGEMEFAEFQVRVRVIRDRVRVTLP